MRRINGDYYGARQRYKKIKRKALPYQETGTLGTRGRRREVTGVFIRSGNNGEIGSENDVVWQVLT